MGRGEPAVVASHLVARVDDELLVGVPRKHLRCRDPRSVYSYHGYFPYISQEFVDLQRLELRGESEVVANANRPSTSGVYEILLVIRL